MDTTINRDPTTQAFQSESCWPGSGRWHQRLRTPTASTLGSGTGPWTNIPVPLFGQASRRTPDMSFDAPGSGAWVLYNNAWYVVGGTSCRHQRCRHRQQLEQPVGVAPSPAATTQHGSHLLYAQLATYKEYKDQLYDVTTGSNGAPATVGWDHLHRRGQPRGKLGK